VKKLEMNDSFDSLNDFFAFLQNDLSSWNNYSRTTTGTGDDYKKALIEKNQFFYTIKDMTRVITNYESQHQFSFWAISELLTEIFAFNPPLMFKYKPEIIEWAYKLRDDKSVEYMYGRRWNEWNQLLNTITTLSKRLDSKRAIIDIFTPYDTEPSRSDLPCTLMYSFKIRDNKLNMSVFYRSHDLFNGVKYDAILSSFIAQIIAMGVNINTGQKITPGTLGVYEDSLHVYPIKDKSKLDLLMIEKHDDPIERFNIMFDGYSKLSELFDDLWNVVRVEESSYYANFEFALEKLSKIKNPAFRDFARMYYNRNGRWHLKQKKQFIEHLDYETKVLSW
jgi:thymidylate synthase